MKKIKKLAALIICFSIIFLTACGKDGQGTYYPDTDEMQKNLEKEGYTVTINSNIHDEYTGTELFAQKDEEFIVFYWLDDAEAVDDFSDIIENSNFRYNKFITMENDSKFGNIVFCGTNKAVDDAGIIIVEVKVE